MSACLVCQSRLLHFDRVRPADKVFNPDAVPSGRDSRTRGRPGGCVASSRFLQELGTDCISTRARCDRAEVCCGRDEGIVGNDDDTWDRPSFWRGGRSVLKIEGPPASVTRQSNGRITDHGFTFLGTYRETSAPAVKQKALSASTFPVLHHPGGLGVGSSNLPAPTNHPVR